MWIGVSVHGICNATNSRSRSVEQNGATGQKKSSSCMAALWRAQQGTMTDGKRRIVRFDRPRTGEFRVRRPRRIIPLAPLLRKACEEEEDGEGWVGWGG